MNTNRVWFTLVALACVPPSLVLAQATIRKPPALGLPRLKVTAKAGEAAPLTGSKFSVSDLTNDRTAGVNAAKRENIDYLVLRPNYEWSQPLRGSARDTTFVSFLVYASQPTVIEIGGAWLSAIESDTRNSMRLMFGQPGPKGVKWQQLGFEISMDTYGGECLAPLPVLTVRLDPAAGVWDVYAHSRLLIAGIPLVEAGGPRRFVVRAGQQGAWICGYVNADENPLFEDANANGIEDGFEKSRRGSLLASAAPAAERKNLAEEWKEHARQRMPKVWVVGYPPPDRLTTPAPAGKP